MIEDIFLPGILLVNAAKERIFMYKMVGFSEACDCVFYGHLGALPDAMDQTDRAIKELEECAGLTEEKPERKRKKKAAVGDDEGEDEGGASKAVKKAVKPRAEKAMKKKGGPAQGKAKGKAALGDDDDFEQVKIADPKLSLYLRKGEISYPPCHFPAFPTPQF